MGDIIISYSTKEAITNKVISEINKLFVLEDDFVSDLRNIVSDSLAGYYIPDSPSKNKFHIEIVKMYGIDIVDDFDSITEFHHFFERINQNPNEEIRLELRVHGYH